MKSNQIILLTIFTFLKISIYSQVITSDNFEKNYNDLIKNLNNENWLESEKAATYLLNFTENHENLETEKKLLRYIKIYSTAGLLNEKIITKNEAKEKTEFVVGKEIIMPANLFNSKCFINCIQLNKDEENSFFSAKNNQKGTQIFAFVYVKIKEKIKETKEELEGKFIVLKGLLNEISIEGNMFPRFKLKLIEGEYEIKSNNTKK